MGPPHSGQIPRVCSYSGYCRPPSLFTYRTITFSGRPSHVVLLRYRVPYAVHTPNVLLHSVWPLPLSLATTHRISIDFSSSAYLDVSVQRVPLHTLWIHVWIISSSPMWFPNSEICGSKLICSSPQLIAACHVLRRLLMPRHSPYALFRLNFLCSILLEFAYNLFTMKKHFHTFYFLGFAYLSICGQIVVFHDFEKDLDFLISISLS